MRKVLYLIVIVSILIACSNNGDNSQGEIIKVTKVKILGGDITLKEGESVILKYATYPEDANQPERFKWSSDDDKIININESNNNVELEALSIGNTIIRIIGIDNHMLADSCIVKVLPIDATSIKISSKNLELFIGSDSTITARIDPANATYKGIKWESSNESVATVDNGKIHAVSEGGTTIYAKSEDNKVSTQCQVVVKPIKVSTISINELENTKKMFVDAKIQLTTSIAPNNATNKDIEIISSNPSIANIDANLKLHAIRNGEVTITAKSKDHGAEKQYKLTIGDITIFTNIGISGSSTSINGYVTGELYSTLFNNSPYPIDITSFKIIDGNNQIIKTATSDLLGFVSANSFSKSLGGQLNRVYNPRFVWTFKYNGDSYEVSKDQ